MTHIGLLPPIPDTDLTAQNRQGRKTEDYLFRALVPAVESAIRPTRIREETANHLRLADAVNCWWASLGQSWSVEAEAYMKVAAESLEHDMRGGGWMRGDQGSGYFRYHLAAVVATYIAAEIAGRHGSAAALRLSVAAIKWLAMSRAICEVTMTGHGNVVMPRCRWIEGSGSWGSDNDAAAHLLLGRQELPGWLFAEIERSNWWTKNTRWYGLGARWLARLVKKIDLDLPHQQVTPSLRWPILIKRRRGDVWGGWDGTMPTQNYSPSPSVMGSGNPLRIRWGVEPPEGGTIHRIGRGGQPQGGDPHGSPGAPPDPGGSQEIPDDPDAWGTLELKIKLPVDGKRVRQWIEDGAVPEMVILHQDSAQIEASWRNHTIDLGRKR